MAFDRAQVSHLLCDCRRRCCICYRFCGTKIETHHIEPESDAIENAIPVCFDCHAEIGHYNKEHPRGRAYTAEELREHKRRWLELCEKHPEVFVTISAAQWQAGPLSALVDEMQFNVRALEAAVRGAHGCPVRDAEFRRAIRTSSLSVLEPALRDAIHDAYVAAGQASTITVAIANKRASGHGKAAPGDVLAKSLPECKERFARALEMMINFERGLAGGNAGD
jgi:hypothetical protein